MTRLSVNINKLATLRNSRGRNNPDVTKGAIDCERFGAQGITVHPRPDERHIRYADVMELKKAVNTEFNIEGYPDEKFIELIKAAKPDQVTLVPDAPDALTSDSGWNTLRHSEMLGEVISVLKKFTNRISVFTGTDLAMIEGAKRVGADRIELYTGPYAFHYTTNREKAVEPFIIAAEKANLLGIGVNAGHDLNLENLGFLVKKIPSILEVSIGHALICDALYFGLENTIQLYRRSLEKR